MEEPHTLVNSAMQQQQQPSVEQEKITEKHEKRCQGKSLKNEVVFRKLCGALNSYRSFISR